MDIVIISEFCEDFSKSDNDRFFYIAKMLSEENSVEIITSNFRHTIKKHRNKPACEWNMKITFIKEPGYDRNLCLKRFKSHYCWGKKVAKYIAMRKKPDVVYCAVPSLTGPYFVAKYCEKQNIRFVIDVQDLWPEAFRMVINIPILSGIVFAPFNILANGIYKRANAICAVSETYCNRAKTVNNIYKEAITVFLGTELAAFDRYAEEEALIEKKVDEIWIGYCGTLGSSYDLTCVIDALDLINDNKVRFIVMGDGPKKGDFEAYAQKKSINISFLGRLPYNLMCRTLSDCDIVVNPITHLAAQSIINKHADYAASGLPVVSTQESDEYRKLIKKYHMGYNCKNNDSEDLAKKIKILIDNEMIRKKMGKNARRCAIEKFDRGISYKNITKLILQG